MTAPDAQTIEGRLIPALMRDFYLFGAEILKIYDPQSKLIPFAPNPYQRELYAALRNRYRTVLIHKSRQLGSSTAIAAYLFYLACFTPRYRVVVVANQHKNAEGLWKIYARFVEHMPAWLRDYLGVTSPHMHIRFSHGGFIDFYTSDSDGVRSQTYQAGHLSEVAHWPDPDRAFASIMGALSGVDPLLFFESTAKGMNIWHELWTQNLGAKKLFFSWVTDRTLDGPPLANQNIPEHITSLQRVWDLTPGQVRWAAKKYSIDCHGSVLLFRQEFPATADEAFVASGSRVLTTFFPHVSAWTEGPMDWAPGHPKQYVPYILGCDVAHGSTTGDYSAIAVLEAADKDRPSIVHTYYGHITPLRFAELIHETANRYKGSLVVVERNENGVSVLERMMQLPGQHYTPYVETIPARHGMELTRTLGWSTNQSSRATLFNAVIEAIDTKHMDIPDPRLQNEINHLIWKGGRPDHDSSHHTDLIVALGLALCGIRQAASGVRYDAIYDRTPRTLSEIVAWQAATGRRVETDADRFRDAPQAVSDHRVGSSILGL